MLATVLKFAVIGVGVGSLYALVAQGLVLVYRGSGVINFAHGATAGVGAYTFYVLHQQHGVPWPVALAAAVVASALVGLAMQVLVMRWMHHASPLTRVIATTALLTVLVQSGNLIFGGTPIFVVPYLANRPVHLSHDIVVGTDRLILLAIAVVLTVLLWAGYRFTRFGLATTATAENELAAGALGVSVDRVALVNWSVGSALAGLAGALISPVVALTPAGMGLLVVPALAAAMLGGFRSFPLTLAGGLGVGILQSELTRYVSTPGWADASPFLVIVAVLVLRGRALPLRGHVLERLPAVGMPNARVLGLIAGLSVGEMIIFATSATWQNAVTTSTAFALISLSVVLVTGYAGQLSLAQYALAGMGAFIAARLDAAAHLPFLLSALCGLIGAAIIGVLVGLPALRTRGINLAIITLGLGLCISDIVFGNAQWTGGILGTTVSAPSLFGYSVDPILHPGRYAMLGVVVLALCAVLVSNLRRSRVGRRLLAVRTNERAAAALGISVTGAKLYAFGVSAAIAAAAGILLAFQNPAVQFGQYSVLNSVNAVVQTVLLGVGYVTAAPLAGAAAPSGLLPHAIDQAVNIDNYIILIVGVALLATLPHFPDGVTAHNHRQLARLLHGRLRARRRSDDEPVAGDAIRRVDAAQLRAANISVAFGGVRAVHHVSMHASSGEVVGLIGPNGAGKTTLLDVLSGFSRQNEGTVTLNDASIATWSPARRARAGLGRSFQSLELFDDLSVRENLLAACEPRDGLSYLTCLTRPGRPRLSSAAAAAVAEFDLTADLDRSPATLSAGRRRLVGLARAVAAEPSILLLDEPAAGLDERETRELGRLIRQLAEQWHMGIVLVEHDLSLVLTVCDRLVVLSDGQLLAEGASAAVAADPAVLEAFIGTSRPDMSEARSVTLDPDPLPPDGVAMPGRPQLLAAPGEHRD